MSKLKGLLVLMFTMGLFNLDLMSQEVNLSLQLKKGDVFTIETVTDQLISQDIMGQKQDQKQLTKMVNRHEVLEVKDGIYTIKVIYGDISVSMDSPMGKMEYDSKNPPEDIPLTLQGFAALKGASFSMQLNNKGEVKNIEGVDAMMDQIIAKMEVPSDEIRERMRESIKTQFGDEALKSSLERSMSIYPDKAVRIGESWNKNLIYSVGMTIQMENVYTLQSIQGNMARMAVSSTISPSEENKPMEMGGMRLFYEMKGTQSGTMEMNIQTGLTQNSAIEQDISGTVRLEGNPQLPDGTSWPISIKSKVSINIVD